MKSGAVRALIFKVPKSATRKQHSAATKDSEESSNNIRMHVILLIKEHMDIFYHSAKLPKVQKPSKFLSNRTLFNSVIQILLFA